MPKSPSRIQRIYSEVLYKANFKVQAKEAAEIVTDLRWWSELAVHKTTKDEAKGGSIGGWDKQHVKTNQMAEG